MVSVQIKLIHPSCRRVDGDVRKSAEIHGRFVATKKVKGQLIRDGQEVYGGDVGAVYKRGGPWFVVVSGGMVT